MYETQIRSLDMVEKKKFLPLSDFDRLPSNSAYSNLLLQKDHLKICKPRVSRKAIGKSIFFNENIQRLRD